MEQQTVTWPLSRASTKRAFVSQQGPGVNEACGCDGQRWALCCLANGSLGVSKRGKTGADGAHRLTKPSHSSALHLHENEAWPMWSHQIHLLFESPSLVSASSCITVPLISYQIIFSYTDWITYVIRHFLRHVHCLTVPLLGLTILCILYYLLPFQPPTPLSPPLKFFLVWRFFPAPPLPRQPHSHRIERPVKREG